MVSTEPVVCPNCESLTATTYCGNCGQRNSRLRLTVRELGRELVESVFKVDGKLFPTVRGLLVPGFLTVEYKKGKRAKYHRPLAVFLVAAGLLFSARSCVGEHTSESSIATGANQITGGLMTTGEGLTDMTPDAAIETRAAQLVRQSMPGIEVLAEP